MVAKVIYELKLISDIHFILFSTGGLKLVWLKLSQFQGWWWWWGLKMQDLSDYPGFNSYKPANLLPRKLL